MLYKMENLCDKCKQEERLERVPTREEAERNKRFFTIAFTLIVGQTVILAGQIGYIIGSVISKAIGRWQNEDGSDDSDDES